MSVGKSVFLVGPGFIGWNVLDLLVEEGYKVEALVRRKEHGEAIEKSGAKAVIGDLNDHETIVEHTLKSDIVFHTATADDLPSVKAILDGVKKRAEKGLLTIYIHTSGAMVLPDSTGGSVKSDKVYTDESADVLDKELPDGAPHRNIDLAILAVHRELGEKAKIAIMTPSMIVGFNPKHERLSIQIPTLTRFAIKHGYAPYVGEGVGVASNVHVLDLAKAYITLLHHMEKAKPSDPSLENIYWFCESTGDAEPSWKEIAATIGEGLHKAGKISDPTPKTASKDMYGELFGDFTSVVFELNNRNRAIRLRELGWKPSEKTWKASFLEDELPAILKQ